MHVRVEAYSPNICGISGFVPCDLHWKSPTAPLYHILQVGVGVIKVMTAVAEAVVSLKTHIRERSDARSKRNSDRVGPDVDMS